MGEIELNHVRTVRTKRGVGRYCYFDTGRCDAKGARIWVALPDPSDARFGAAYARLLGQRNRTPSRTALGIRQLYDLWLNSPDYARLALASKKLYRRYAGEAVELLHPAAACEIEPRDIQLIMDKSAHRPGAANCILAATSAMFAWGKKPTRAHVAVNPCEGVEPFELGVHAPWPDHVLAAALTADDWHVRSTTATLFYTGQRVGDAVKLVLPPPGVTSWQVSQQKTGWDGLIPMHSELAAVVEERRAMRHPALTVLTSADGRRPSSKVRVLALLQTWVQERFGIRVVSHGLRANAINVMLDLGLSVPQVASITGQSFKTVEAYDRKRAQSTRARGTIAAWERGGNVKTLENNHAKSL